MSAGETDGARHASGPSSFPGARAWGWVVAGGLLAGALDITYAGVFWALKASVPFSRILQSVAAGLLGTASFAGGAPTAALGLTLHLSIATTMSVTYFAVSLVMPVLRARPWLFGGLYGAALYVVMNFVVIPLSATTRGAADPLWVTLSVVVHIVLIGMPIAHCAQRAGREGGR